MIFDKVIDRSDFSSNLEVKKVQRVAVRAVILKDNELLMVHSKLGDYKFPGGGVKKLEDYNEALKREVLEETGYKVKDIKEKLGVIVERSKDSYEENCIFEMISHYYLCTIEEEKTNQSLDDYEAELEFTAKFIDIGKAILENQNLLDDETREKRDWTIRENLALKLIKEEFDLRKAIESFERELFIPEVRNNKKRLDELIHDDFNEFGVSGRTFNKLDMIIDSDNTQNVQIVAKDFIFSHIEKDTMLVTYESYNHDTKVCALRSSIWKNENNKWQLLFHQGTYRAI